MIKEFNIDEMIKEGCLITAGDIIFIITFNT